MIIHKPTGKIYNNRLEAKLDMGYSNYNKANKRGEFTLHIEFEKQKSNLHK